MSHTRIDQNEKTNENAVVDIEESNLVKAVRKPGSGGAIRHTFKDRKLKKELDASVQQDGEVVIHHKRLGYTDLFRRIENLSVDQARNQEKKVTYKF